MATRSVRGEGDEIHIPVGIGIGADERIAIGPVKAQFAGHAGAGVEIRRGHIAMRPAPLPEVMDPIVDRLAEDHVAAATCR